MCHSGRPPTFIHPSSPRTALLRAGVDRRYRPPVTIRARVTRSPPGSARGGGLVALLSALIGPAAAQAAPGGSRPVYSYDHAIRESVWVDTRLDGDTDGRTDRVAVDIVRPRNPRSRAARSP